MNAFDSFYNNISSSISNFIDRDSHISGAWYQNGWLRYVSHNNPFYDLGVGAAIASVGLIALKKSGVVSEAYEGVKSCFKSKKISADNAKPLPIETAKHKVGRYLAAGASVVGIGAGAYMMMQGYKHRLEELADLQGCEAQWNSAMTQEDRDQMLNQRCYEAGKLYLSGNLDAYKEKVARCENGTPLDTDRCYKNMRDGLEDAQRFSEAVYDPKAKYLHYERSMAENSKKHLYCNLAPFDKDNLYHQNGQPIEGVAPLTYSYRIGNYLDDEIRNKAVFHNTIEKYFVKEWSPNW